MAVQAERPDRLGAWTGERPGSRFGVACSLAISLAVHALVLLLASGVFVRIAGSPSSRIFVTLREMAPPPAASAAAVSAPEKKPPQAEAPESELRLARAEPTQPPTPAPTRPPEPTRRPQPKPTARPAKRAVSPAPAPSKPPAEGESGAGNVLVARGGVLGGSAGGLPGGVIGGRGDKVWQAAAVAVPPSVLFRSMPEYPAVARARGVEGLVILEAVVGRDGRIENDDVAVVQSIALLEDAAVEALRRWRFRPGRDESGRPVRVRVQVPIRFRLR